MCHGCNITIPDDAHPVSKFLDTYFSTGDLENVFQTHTQLRKNDSDRNLTINLLESVAMTNLIHPEDGHVAFVANLFTLYSVSKQLLPKSEILLYYLLVMVTMSVTY